MPRFAVRTPRERVFVVLRGTGIVIALHVLDDMTQQSVGWRQGLVVVERQLRAGGTLHVDLAPPGNVRAEIVDVRAIRRTYDLDRRERVEHPTGQRDLGRLAAGGGILLHLRRPFVETLALATRIVPFTVAQGREHDRRIVGAPLSVGDENRAAIADERTANLGRGQPDAIGKIPGTERKGVEPAIAEQHANPVLALAQQLRHVETNARQPPVGLAGDGRKDILARLCAVHLDFAPACHGNLKDRAFRHGVQRKRPIQRGCGFLARLGIARNPFRDKRRADKTAGRCGQENQSGEACCFHASDPIIST